MEPLTQTFLKNLFCYPYKTGNKPISRGEMNSPDATKKCASIDFEAAVMLRETPRDFAVPFQDTPQKAKCILGVFRDAKP